jgi:hypothetical protein
MRRLEVERIGEWEPEMRLQALRWAVGGDAGGSGCGACGRGSQPRLREASGSPSDPTTRVCRWIGWTRAGRTAAKAAGIVGRMPLSGHGRTVPRTEIATREAPRGERAPVMGAPHASIGRGVTKAPLGASLPSHGVRGNQTTAYPAPQTIRVAELCRERAQWFQKQWFQGDREFYGRSCARSEHAHRGILNVSPAARASGQRSAPRTCRAPARG